MRDWSSDVGSSGLFALASEALDQGRADPDAHGLADPSDLAGACAPEALQKDIFDRAPFRLAISGAAILFTIARGRQRSLVAGLQVGAVFAALFGDARGADAQAPLDFDAFATLAAHQANAHDLLGHPAALFISS